MDSSCEVPPSGAVELSSPVVLYPPAHGASAPGALLQMIRQTE